MSYQEKRGNLFSSHADAFVNTINCHGVMGKGIALEFRRRYPMMFDAYQIACQQNEISPGQIWKYKTKDRWLLNFAVKDHWRYPSKIAWIESSLKQFKEIYKNLDITSVAFPMMGAMNGGIPVEVIRTIMRKYLEPITDLQIEIYDFDSKASDPLFILLEEIIVSEKYPQFISLVKIPRNKQDLLHQYVLSKRIASMTQFVESRIVGDKTIDHIYRYLAEKVENSSSTANEIHQISLFE